MNRIKTEVKEVSVLLRSIPSLTMTLFIVSVITMNLLANKSINLVYLSSILMISFVLPAAVSRSTPNSY